MNEFNFLIWIVFLKALAVLCGYIDKKHSHILSENKIFNMRHPDVYLN